MTTVSWSAMASRHGPLPHSSWRRSAFSTVGSVTAADSTRLLAMQQEHAAAVTPDRLAGQLQDAVERLLQVRFLVELPRDLGEVPRRGVRHRRSLL